MYIFFLEIYSNLNCTVCTLFNHYVWLTFTKNKSICEDEQGAIWREQTGFPQYCKCRFVPFSNIRKKNDFTNFVYDIEGNLKENNFQFERVAFVLHFWFQVKNFGN